MYPRSSPSLSPCWYHASPYHFLYHSPSHPWSHCCGPYLRPSSCCFPYGSTYYSSPGILSITVIFILFYFAFHSLFHSPFIQSSFVLFSFLACVVILDIHTFTACHIAVGWCFYSCTTNSFLRIWNSMLTYKFLPSYSKYTFSHVRRCKMQILVGWGLGGGLWGWSGVDPLFLLSIIAGEDMK